MSNESNPSAEPAKSRFLVTLLLALVIVMLAAAGGAGAWWFMFGRHAAPHPAEVAAAPVVEVKPPVYTELKPFTVNVNDADGRMLYVGLSLQMQDQADIQTLNQHLPEIRNRILMLLSSQKIDSLSSPQDKERLANDIKGCITSPLESATTTIGVRLVLFTDFIVQ